MNFKIKKEEKKICLVVLILVIIDQIIKFAVTKGIAYQNNITIIRNFCYLTYARNTGGAWSILEGSQIFLVVASIVFLLVLFYYIKHEEKLDNFTISFYSLIIGGALGNIIDRVVHNYVIDFIYFKIVSYYTPIFNFADCCIVIGVLLLLFNEVKKKCKKLS